MGRVPVGNTTSGFYEAAVTKAGTNTRVSPKYHESTTSQRGGAARTMAMGSQGTEEEEDDVDDDTDTEDEQEGETDVKRDCLGEADGHEAYFMAESAPVRRPRNPAEPTKLEVEQHWATHLPYRPWCPICCKARGREDPHIDQRKRKRKVERARALQTSRWHMQR